MSILHNKILILERCILILCLSSNWYFLQVLYNTTGFLEKNRDPLHPDTIHLLSSCSSQLPQMFASSMQNQARKPLSHGLGASEFHKRSVGTKFKVRSFYSSLSLWTDLNCLLMHSSTWNLLSFKLCIWILHENVCFHINLSIESVYFFFGFKFRSALLWNF